MVRWRPGARERLVGAALERFAVLGFDGTTVAAIAAAAGVTERTFYRYFADKREVLFHGQDIFERTLVDGLVDAAAAPPMVMVAAALSRGDELFTDERRPWSRARQAVIDADPNLQERELLKMASLAAAMTAALRGRGVDATAAALAGETGVALLRVAFAAWIADAETRSFGEVVAALLGDLRGLAADI